MTTLIVKMVKSYDQIFGGSSLQLFFSFFLVFSFDKKNFCCKTKEYIVMLWK
jgi:hypothetical protein